MKDDSNSEKLMHLLTIEKDKNRQLLERFYTEDACKRDKSLPPGSGRDKSPRNHSRGRFTWRKGGKGLEKSKSLDQSEFLSSLSHEEIQHTTSWKKNDDCEQGNMFSE